LKPFIASPTEKYQYKEASNWQQYFAARTVG